MHRPATCSSRGHPFHPTGTHFPSLLSEGLASAWRGLLDPRIKFCDSVQIPLLGRALPRQSPSSDIYFSFRFEDSDWVQGVRSMSHVISWASPGWMENRPGRLIRGGNHQGTGQMWAQRRIVDEWLCSFHSTLEGISRFQCKNNWEIVTPEKL